MQQLIDLMNELNLTPEQLKELAQCGTNPFALMQKIQELKISPSFLQKAMQMMQENPEMMTNMARQAGVSEDLLEKAQAFTNKTQS